MLYGCIDVYKPSIRRRIIKYRKKRNDMEMRKNKDLNGKEKEKGVSVCLKERRRRES